MSNAWVVNGKNATALFTLKVRRGEGMALLAMNWKNGTPPHNFVGFAIEYKEPEGATVLPAQEPTRLPQAPTARSIRMSSRRSCRRFRSSAGSTFPSKRGSAGRVHLSGHAGVHGRARRRELRGGAGGGHRAAARDLPGRAQRRASRADSSRRRRLWTATRPTGDLEAAAGRRRRAGSTSCRRTRRRRSPRMDGVRGAAAPSCSVAGRGDRRHDGRGARGRLRPERAAGRQSSGAARDRGCAIIIDNSGDHGEPGSAENAGRRRGSCSRPGATNVKRQHMAISSTTRRSS